MAYLAMTGATQTFHAQAVNSNNLANLSTPGFREDLHAFSNLAIEGPGFPSRVNAVAESPGWSNAPGSIVSSGRDMDVAVNGPGWIAVQAPNGDEAYTRAGDLRVTSLGLLTTGAGHPVMSESGPISLPPNSSLTIGVDGELSIIALGDAPQNLTASGTRIKLVNPDVAFMEKGIDGLFRYKDGNVTIANTDPQVNLIPGSLEGSNVNAVSSMLNMIQLARQFEMQVRTMDTANQNATNAIELMQVS